MFAFGRPGFVQVNGDAPCEYRWMASKDDGLSHAVVGRRATTKFVCGLIVLYPSPETPDTVRCLDCEMAIIQNYSPGSLCED